MNPFQLLVLGLFRALFWLVLVLLAYWLPKRLSELILTKPRFDFWLFGGAPNKTLFIREWFLFIGSWSIWIVFSFHSYLKEIGWSMFP